MLCVRFVHQLSWYPRRPSTRKNVPPGEAARRIERARLSDARELDLEGLWLTAIPDALGQVTQLQKECGWNEVSNLKKFQILRDPLPDRNRDKYWRTVAEELQKTITKLREFPRPTFPRDYR